MRPERSSGCWSKAARKLPSVGCAGSHVGSTEPSSRGALNAVDRSQRRGKARKAR
ncbi:putative transport system integral membrane protein [Streptomyces sp. Tu6071]|nr:putative transport system integral membrane protein [Streptomyces sp. Tu6071]